MAKRTSPPNDSEIVFRDLEHAFEKLGLVAENPAELRRALREFVNLTQQLTEVFRHEYSQLRGRKWIAGSFPGWTPVTSLFNKLRRSNYHEHPFLIDVQHKQLMPFLKGSDGRLVALDVHYQTAINDPLRQDLPPRTMVIELPKTGTRLKAVRESSRCILRGRTAEVRSALAAAGTADVLELAASCMETLREYYAFYRDQLTP